MRPLVLCALLAMLLGIAVRRAASPLPHTRAFFSGASALFPGWARWSLWSSQAPPPPHDANSLHYLVSVAYQPKDRDRGENKFLPKKSPAVHSPTGEDNFFAVVPPAGALQHLAVGVADGVGGWSEIGYDLLAISRELCRSMGTLFGSNHALTPKQLLALAFQEIQKSGKVEIGGTTACLGTLDPLGLLQVANLGDSWCGVFRGSKCVLETEFQTHGFNTPFQLAVIPEKILAQARAQGKRYIRDAPTNADEYRFQLEKGDVVMFATDGVTDNIAVRDMEIFLQDRADRLVSQEGRDEITSEFVAKVVELAKDPTYPSVFAQELSRLSGQKYLGGKEDDITVVVVVVE